ELALADRARRLGLLDRARASEQAHLPHPTGDRPARDEDDLVAGGPQAGGSVADAREDVDPGLAPVVGDDRRAQLDHDPPHRSAYSGSSSKTMPAISTSSPAVKP